MGSVPLTLCLCQQFHLVPGSTGDWAAHGADFGKVASKKLTIFGFKLHLLVSLGGLILDFELALVSAADLNVGAELLTEHTDLTVFGDKGSIRSELTRKNQANQPPKAVTCSFNAVRQWSTH